MKTLKNRFLMPEAAIIFAIAASAFTATSGTEDVDYRGECILTVMPNTSRSISMNTSSALTGETTATQYWKKY